jgi:hypothetical protein
LAGRAQRPGGAAWLLPRANGLPITTGVSVVSASDRADQIDLKLDDGSHRSVDHVLLATGYRFDISNLPFLSADLISGIGSVRGFPVLSKTMESSIPRLHFVGVAAADTFGPLMRFVSGTGYCSRNLVRGVCGQCSPAPALSPQVDAAGVKHCNASSPASL